MQTLSFHSVLELRLEPTKLIPASSNCEAFATATLVVRHDTLSGPQETRIEFYAANADKLLLAPQLYPMDAGAGDEDCYQFFDSN